jgi:hypothetical protein
LAKSDTNRPSDKPSEASQRQRFIETARELGCDEDEASFDEKLRRIATVKPKRPEKIDKSVPKGPKR